MSLSDRRLSLYPLRRRGGGRDPPNNARTSTFAGKILRIDVDQPARSSRIRRRATTLRRGAGRLRSSRSAESNPWRFSFRPRAASSERPTSDWRAREKSPADRQGRLRLGCSSSLHRKRSGCNPANYIGPVFDYMPTGGRCSITGGYVYRGPQNTLPQGTYVYGDFCSGEISRGWRGAGLLSLPGSISRRSAKTSKASSMWGPRRAEQNHDDRSCVRV